MTKFSPLTWSLSFLASCVGQSLSLWGPNGSKILKNTQSSSDMKHKQLRSLGGMLSKKGVASTSLHVHQDDSPLVLSCLVCPFLTPDLLQFTTPFATRSITICLHCSPSSQPPLLEAEAAVAPHPHHRLNPGPQHKT